MIEERVKPISNAYSRFAIKAIGYDLNTHHFLRGKELICLHDPLAVGVVIDRDLVTKERLALEVETEEGEYYGKVSEVKEGPKIEVCLGVNAERFLELFVSRLANQ